MLQKKSFLFLTCALFIFFITRFTFEVMTFRYATANYVSMYVPHMTALLTSSSEFASNTRFIISQWIDKNVGGSTEHRLTGYTSTRAVGMVPLGSNSKDSDVRMHTVRRTYTVTDSRLEIFIIVIILKSTELNHNFIICNFYILSILLLGSILLRFLFSFLYSMYL